uniref:Superoxide dismutase n=1 Tax=Salarias fasciatus TaxID=181472 RepID=A0A672FQX9_SALFA
FCGCFSSSGLCPLKVGQTLMRTVRQAVRPAAASRQKYTLPDLNYDYGALEPHICAETMWLHHSFHHATHVKNLNRTMEKFVKAVEMGDETAQEALQTPLIFQGGGHLNHSIFWNSLSPNGGGQPRGVVMDAIMRNFGSFENMKQQMSAASVSWQGPGWSWLGYNRWDGKLEIATCANEDPLQGTTGLIPLLGFDLWKHAYYHQYNNSRSDYIEALWNVINWDVVNDRFMTAERQQIG